MKITKLLATAAGLAALTACGGGETNTAENMDANLTDMNAGMDMNMPADNIKRAILKGTGGLDGQTLEEFRAELYSASFDTRRLAL